MWNLGPGPLLHAFPAGCGCQVSSIRMRSVELRAQGSGSGLVVYGFRIEGLMTGVPGFRILEA